MADNSGKKRGKFKMFALIFSAGILLCAIILGAFFVFKNFGNPMRAEKIYLQALKDFNEGNYSNAYYQFSKVSFLSDLKPYAIFKRAECAHELGDTKSEQRQYQLLYNIYPTNVLSTRAKYLIAVNAIESSPQNAKKLFEEILLASPDTDYGIGANYHLASLLVKNHTAELLKDELIQTKLNDYLKTYLTKAPTGRWALKAVDLWRGNVEVIAQEDKLLIADIYMLYNNNDKAIELLENVDFNFAWAKLTNAYLAKKDYKKAKSILENGLKLTDTKVSLNDEINTVTKFLSVQKDKTEAVKGLYKALEGRNDEYIYMLKCKYEKNDNVRQVCFNVLTENFAAEKLSEPVLLELFMSNALNSRTSTAIELGAIYEKNYPESPNNEQVLYWLGTMYKLNNQPERADEYFKMTILTYPDSYYALRSYLKLNNINNSIITTVIEPKEVIFPYYGDADSTIIKLVEYGDLSTLSSVYENDKFVQSWILYEKGEKSKGMVMARDAMAELAQKPDKADLRWRLVYPTFMHEDMKKFAQQAGNNAVLMLALTREESYFNPNAHSYVGAVGLMQLMPATAKEISRIRNLPQYSPEELKTPEINLKLGNYYYNFLLNNLGNNNILSVAAYNGGIGSINRWKEGLEYRNIDEFIEKIPYPETRNYVKKVFRTYWNYTRIYL